MEKSDYTRRRFIATASAGSVATIASTPLLGINVSSQARKLAVLGGIPVTAYIRNELHKEPWVRNILNMKVYQKMYSTARILSYLDELDCPVCDKSNEEIVMIWASGPLLGTIKDMDDVADAILKVYENRDILNSI